MINEIYNFPSFNSDYTIKEGFAQSYGLHSLFVKCTSAFFFLALLAYVDDIIIGSNNPTTMIELKSNLSLHFKMKDLGIVNYLWV